MNRIPLNKDADTNNDGVISLEEGMRHHIGDFFAPSMLRRGASVAVLDVDEAAQRYALRFTVMDDASGSDAAGSGELGIIVVQLVPNGEELRTLTYTRKINNII